MKSRHQHKHLAKLRRLLVFFTGRQTVRRQSRRLYTVMIFSKIGTAQVQTMKGKFMIIINNKIKYETVHTIYLHTFDLKMKTFFRETCFLVIEP